MKVSLTQEGLLDPRKLEAWTRRKQQSIHQAMNRAMRAQRQPMQAAAQGAMQSAFKVRKRAFVRSMRAKVYDRDKTRMPALYVGSKIPWLGIHVTGGTIQGPKRLLIPLLPEHQRIGRKAFRQVIERLMAAGNAYFIEKGDRVILMAEVIPENAGVLRRFKRAERARTGAKSIKRGQEIPIAVLVPSVQIKRRLDLEGTVRRRLPELAQAIQRELTLV
jgi:hypothetical protein